MHQPKDIYWGLDEDKERLRIAFPISLDVSIMHTLIRAIDQDVAPPSGSIKFSHEPVFNIKGESHAVYLLEAYRITDESTSLQGREFCPEPLQKSVEKIITRYRNLIKGGNPPDQAARRVLESTTPQVWGSTTPAGLLITGEVHNTNTDQVTVEKLARPNNGIRVAFPASVTMPLEEALTRMLEKQFEKKLQCKKELYRREGRAWHEYRIPAPDDSKGADVMYKLAQQMADYYSARRKEGKNNDAILSDLKTGFKTIEITAGKDFKSLQIVFSGPFGGNTIFRLMRHLTGLFEQSVNDADQKCLEKSRTSSRYEISLPASDILREKAHQDIQNAVENFMRLEKKLSEERAIGILEGKEKESIEGLAGEAQEKLRKSLSESINSVLIASGLLPDDKISTLLQALIKAVTRQFPQGIDTLDGDRRFALFRIISGQIAVRHYIPDAEVSKLATAVTDVLCPLQKTQSAPKNGHESGRS